MKTSLRVRSALATVALLFAAITFAHSAADEAIFVFKAPKASYLTLSGSKTVTEKRTAYFVYEPYSYESCILYAGLISGSQQVVDSGTLYLPASIGLGKPGAEVTTVAGDGGSDRPIVFRGAAKNVIVDSGTAKVLFAQTLKARIIGVTSTTSAEVYSATFTFDEATSKLINDGTENFSQAVSRVRDLMSDDHPH